MIRLVLHDIEGTTTAIDFVHHTLFPYAAQHLPEYVRAHAHEPRVRAQLHAVQATMLAENAAGHPMPPTDDEALIAQLLAWIAADRKHTALKTLQGFLWREGYEAGHFTGHIYPDVPPAWLRWRGQGLRLAIYSSGSVEAQQLLFGFSDYGDLTPHLEAYFDTHTGPKREADSYLAIAQALHLPTHEVLFLSDIVAELDAAAQAGMHTIQLLRPGTVAGKGHALAHNFTEINPVDFGR